MVVSCVKTLTKEKLWESYGKPWAIYGPYMGMVWKGRVVYGTDMGPYFGRFYAMGNVWKEKPMFFFVW